MGVGRWLQQVVVLCCSVGVLYGQGLDEMMDMSLEDLMQVEVFSAAKKEQDLFEVSAAISVITREDIRRSGKTTIPELLRLVPGVQVGRIDANKWGVTIRGFNDRFSNKLLVLIDGRSLYSPLFAGVFWRELDFPLDDIERIEVVRGPGATLWGANAVNGTINIITRHAEDTAGLVVGTRVGNEERGALQVRYGAPLAANAHYRVYALGHSQNSSAAGVGMRAVDQWDGGRSGLRLDWVASERDELFVSADFYRGEAEQTYDIVWSLEAPYRRVFVENSKYNGGHLLTRWQRNWSADRDGSLQVYYDRHDLDDAVFSVARNTIDFEGQVNIRRGRHAWAVGGGYRYSKDKTQGAILSSLDPADMGINLFSLFVQDDMALVPERLHLTLGSKIEHNDFTGFEIQPNARLLWRVHRRQSLWLAVSRAVRTPSRSDLHVEFPASAIAGARPGDPLSIISFTGNPAMRAEDLLALELGYRVQPSETFFVEGASFYNIYSDLRSTQLGRGTIRSEPVDYIYIPITAGNESKARTWGLELEADWQLHRAWRLRAAYTLLQIDIDAPPGDAMGRAAEGESPEHQFYLGSTLDLAKVFTLDAGLSYTGELPALGIDGYANLDLRFGWRPAESLEVALVGQQLLAARREEFRPQFLNTLPAESERGFYLSLYWTP
jgi:iron complex outermembrane receptor protein